MTLFRVLRNLFVNQTKPPDTGDNSHWDSHAVSFAVGHRWKKNRCVTLTPTFTLRYKLVDSWEAFLKYKWRYSVFYMKDVKSVKDKIYEGQKKIVIDRCDTVKRRLSNQFTKRKIRIQKKFTSKTRTLRETRCPAPPAHADTVCTFARPLKKFRFALQSCWKTKRKGRFWFQISSFKVKYKVLNIFCNKTKVFITKDWLAYSSYWFLNISSASVVRIWL